MTILWMLVAALIFVLFAFALQWEKRRSRKEKVHRKPPFALFITGMLVIIFIGSFFFHFTMIDGDLYRKVGTVDEYEIYTQGTSMDLPFNPEQCVFMNDEQKMTLPEAIITIELPLNEIQHTLERPHNALRSLLEFIEETRDEMKTKAGF